MVRKPIVDLGGGKKGVELEELLLALIGAGDAEALSLTTDGRSLILSPATDELDSGADRVAEHPAHATDCDDPKETVRIINELRPLGLSLERFRRLHHNRAGASLENHLKYCMRIGRFTSATNVDVCRRLGRCLDLRRRGVDWDEALETALREFPIQGK